MKRIFKELDLSYLIGLDRRFDFRLNPEITDLQESINLAGILKPIMINSESILTGHSRISSADILNLGTIPVFEIENTGLRKVLDLIWEDNFDSNLDLIDNARLIGKFIKYGLNREALFNFCRGHAIEMLEVINKLSHKEQSRLRKVSGSDKVRVFLVSLSSDLRQLFLDLSDSGIKLTVPEMKRFVEFQRLNMVFKKFELEEVTGEKSLFNINLDLEKRFNPELFRRRDLIEKVINRNSSMDLKISLQSIDWDKGEVNLTLTVSAACEIDLGTLNFIQKEIRDLII